MKKKTAWIVAAVLAVVCICLIFFHPSSGTKPFQDLNAASIQGAVIRLTPPDTEIKLEQSEIQELVKLLQQIIVLEEDDTKYAGQLIDITLAKTDGSQVDISLCSPSLVWEGKSYKAYLESCEAITRYAEWLRSLKEDS